MLARYHTHVGGVRRALLRWVIFLLLATLPVIPTRAASNLHGARVVSASPENTVAVTTTADLVDGDTSSFSTLNSQPGADGAISLREALLAANATPTATLDLTITFSIPITDTGYSYDIASDRDTWAISVDSDNNGYSSLPALARGHVRIDGSTQPGAGSGPHVVLDGSNDFDLYTGLTITSANNLVRGLTIINFYNNGISISGSAAANNQVAGCYIGPDASGLSTQLSNGYGVNLSDGAHDNLIGGNTLADRNLISGNADEAGVRIADAATANNTVAGNWIGVDATGLAALANLGAGVSISGGAHNNTIGGATPAARNLISGNGYGGVVIQDAATANNTVAGNWIGVDATGLAALSNAWAGVWIYGAQHNRIGGVGQGNLISGNEAGIDILGGDANTVAGNTIGLAADGTKLGNRDVGLYIRAGARDNLIGGTTAGARNVIAGNDSVPTAYGQGIYINGAGTTNNTIQGNYIGVDASGNKPAGNRGAGVLISDGADRNTIGGTAETAGNVIAYNGGGGIVLFSAFNLVARNLIGLGANGTPLGNQFDGIRIWYPNNVIGPYNYIAYSHLSGIMLSGSNTTIISNTLEGNSRSGICVAGASATISLNTIRSNGGDNGPYLDCNIQGGIVITGTIAATMKSNIIHDNIGAGITVRTGTENRILSNSISGNTGGGIVLLLGGNANIAAPTIESASPSQVSGTSCAFCHVEIFTDDADQGLNYITATTALFDGSFAIPLTPGALDPPHVTATNTDTSGNTSPFAAPKDVVDDPPGPPERDKHVFLPIVRMR
jgi:parallel beta-helix repeat protein